MTVHGRAYSVAIIAGLALAAVPASAAADTLIDDSFADFAAAPSSTTTWAVEPGAVTLRPTDLSESFEGAALPPSLTAVPWPSGGDAVVGSGAMTVDGARVHPADTTQTAPQTLEFRATFSGAAFQHVGFATDFIAPPHAIFSTGGVGLPTGLYARTDDGAGTVIDTPLALDPLQAHTYRIEWLPNEVRYFVDGAVVATHAVAVAGPMRPAASDFNAGSGAITVDYLGIGSNPATGVFESRVQDAGDARAVWGDLTATSAGGTVAFATRTGNAPSPDGTWSDWELLGAGGEIGSPIARYIQYRATLSGSPSLDRVELDYDVDTVAPVAAIDGVDVTGGSASVTFSSAATDVARFECRLDAPGAAFETCTSPKAFSGLSTGSHAVLVRAVDRAGNIGDAAQQSFAVDPDGPVAAIDGVDVIGGSASVRFSSAATDLDRFECRLDAPGAVFQTCTSPKAFSGLAPGSYTVLVQAVDQNGNVGPVVQRQFTIPSPPASGGGGTTPPPGGDPGPGVQPDGIAPAVRILTGSARASRTGVVSVRMSCPADEVSCRVTVRLKHGRKSSRAKSMTILGGKQATLRLKLPKATRTLLAARGKLKLTTLVTARDAAGNVRRTSRKLTLTPVSSTIG